MENKNLFGHSTEERQEINMYTCKLCSSVYVWPDSLKRHLKYKHNMQESEALRQQQQQQQEMQHEQQQESLQQQEEMIQQQQQREMPQQQHEMQQQQQDFSFQHPFTANVSGPTYSGKTYFVKMLLQHCKTKISPPPERILWLYKRWQALYDVIKTNVYPPVEFIQGIPLDLEQDFFIHPRTRNLVILDDLMSTAAKDSRINELFTEGSHHRNLSVIAINQNMYYNKDPTQRRNRHL